MDGQLARTSSGRVTQDKHSIGIPQPPGLEALLLAHSGGGLGGKRELVPSPDIIRGFRQGSLPSCSPVALPSLHQPCQMPRTPAPAIHSVSTRPPTIMPLVALQGGLRTTPTRTCCLCSSLPCLALPCLCALPCSCCSSSARSRGFAWLLHCPGALPAPPVGPRSRGS